MISRKIFGVMPDSREVEEFHLTNTKGLSAHVITYGGIITQLHVPDARSRLADIVLGFDNLPQYLAGHPYFGCIAGRIAGRLTRGKFSLDGQEYSLATNDSPNHLHGGHIGFDKRIWKAEISGSGATSKLKLTYLSPDGEEGYPGNVAAHVTYSLTEQNEFIVNYEATTDRATPLSLTSHSYFNLAGAGNGSVENHQLQIFADDYAPTDDHMAHLDIHKAVAGSGNDFTRPQRLGDVIPALWKQHGDNYFIRRSNNSLAPVASLTDPAIGRKMEIHSTAPCVQLYTGMALDGALKGKSGRPYTKHGGLCLECQGYPNGINAPALGDITLRPGEIYRQTTVHKFSSI